MNLLELSCATRKNTSKVDITQKKAREDASFAGFSYLIEVYLSLKDGIQTIWTPKYVASLVN